MQLRVNNTVKDRGVVVGVCLAEGITVSSASDQLGEKLTALIQTRSAQEFPPPEVKDAVRNLLKTGGFKPSGRNKPASEYLAQAAREGRFPLINNLVDVNNLVSLTYGLPISLLDAAEFADGGSQYCVSVRYGHEGERYVFNASGQEIDLTGLICVCSPRDDLPLGNPIKDSMRGKIKDSTSSVVGIIFAPDTLAHSAKEALDLFAQLLKEEGRASSVETVIA